MLVEGLRCTKAPLRSGVSVGGEATIDAAPLAAFPCAEGGGVIAYGLPAAWRGIVQIPDAERLVSQRDELLSGHVARRITVVLSQNSASSDLEAFGSAGSHAALAAIFRLADA